MSNRFRQAGMAKRLWILVAILWLPAAIMLAIDRMPDEAPIRERTAKKLEREQMSSTYATLKEIEQHCNTTVPGAQSGLPPFPPEYAVCLESKNYFDVLKKWMEESVAGKSAQDEADQRTIGEGRRNAILFGVAVWVVPVLALYLLGMAFRRTVGRSRDPDRPPAE